MKTISLKTGICILFILVLFIITVTRETSADSKLFASLAIFCGGLLSIFSSESKK